jgi:hypothetical protein
VEGEIDERGKKKGKIDVIILCMKYWAYEKHRKFTEVCRCDSD